jgi:GT2 family glycosyltransferase/glycosyltransferase involved in cell wall biosynthesis
MKKVSIIIPVYNALNYLKQCIQSIQNSNCDTDYEVIVINDCSPDKEVDKYLMQLNYPNIKVYANEVNLGFVGTCNKGMDLANDNDVCLLNSDTEVTQKFLDKIQKIAYADPSIGTVTPMSNSASILSIPFYCQESPLPDGLTPEKANLILESIYLDEIPVLPTGNGFCMYIKRELIDCIGKFDEQNFGKGYGEENDFCLRAHEAGFLNVADVSTFIYHKAHASFNENNTISQEVINLKQKNSNFLHNKYPYWQSWIEDFVANSIIKKKVQIFNFIFKLSESKKPIILIIKHREEPIGGVGHHTNILMSYLEKFNFLELSPYENSLKLVYYDDDRNVTELYIDNPDCNDFKIFVTKTIKLLNEFIDFRHIHIQHLLGFDISLLGLTKSINVSVSLTIHDLYLINRDLNFIHNPSNNDEIISDEDYAKRLNYLFTNIDKIIVPSKYILDTFNRNLQTPVNMKIIENGIKIAPKKKATISQQKALNIAFLGKPVKNKGIETFLNLIKDLKQNADVNFYIIGRPEYDFESMVQAHFLVQGVDFNIHHYQDGNAYDLMHDLDIDLVILPSEVRESFSMTLSEALSFGVPVLAKDVGAIGQRLKSYKVGFLYSEYSELLTTIMEIIKDKQILNQQIELIKKLKIQDGQSMSNEYIDYLELDKNYHNVKYDLSKLPKDLVRLLAFKKNNNPIIITTRTSIKHEIAERLKKVPLLYNISRKLYKIFLRI